MAGFTVGDIRFAVCVFVDGANFRYVLSKLLTDFDANTTPLDPSMKWRSAFEMLAKKAGESCGLPKYQMFRTHWYVPEAVWRSDRAQLRSRKDHEDRYERRRSAQTSVQMAWDRLHFRRAGHMTLAKDEDGVLTEKGVDVALAVDMVTLQHTYEIAAVISRDADLVPAVQAVQREGRLVAVPKFIDAPTKKPLVPHSDRLFEAADGIFPVSNQDLLAYLS